MSSSGYRDYFNVLGVERDANSESIKSAFRKLARKYHPDVNPGDLKAESKFKEISEAYEVLSDPDKRRRYEQFGQYWDQRGSRTQNGFDVDFGNYGNFDEFINDLLGRFGAPRGSSGFPSGGVPNRNSAQNSLNLDAEIKVEISFREAFHGTSRTLSVNEERVQVKIPPGVKYGSRLRLQKKGNIQPGTGKRGDLYLIIQVSTHSIWRLEGNQVFADLPLSLDEIVLGAIITVPTLDGQAELTVPPGTSEGTNLRLKAKGWPLNDVRGDLIFTIKMVLPDQWSSEELQHFHDLRRIRCKNPRESWLKSARI